jgi:predicted MFS family arabinose efflux permease
MSKTVRPATRPRYNVALLVAGSAAFSVSTLFSSMKPVLISRFVEEAHYSPSVAGLAAAMPFVGGVFSSLILPTIIRRLSGAAALVSFGIALAVVEAISAFLFRTPALLLLGQCFAGVCGGVLMGLVSRSIAVSARSEQSFGIVDMVGVMMMSLMIAIIGAAVEWNGLRGGFLASSGLCAVFAVIMAVSGRGLVSEQVSGSAVTQTRLEIGWRAVAVIAMGVAFVTFSGVGFAFMFTAARNLGFSYETAGSAIGVILLFSAIGCLLGGWCAARFGARSSLLGAFTLCALGWHVALTTQDQWTFLLSLGPAIFALQFCFPILLALAGSLDDEGRVAAVAAPLIVSGFAWAAVTAGLVVDRWGISTLPIVTEIGMVICACLLFAGTGARGHGEASHRRQIAPAALS